MYKIRVWRAIDGRRRFFCEGTRKGKYVARGSLNVPRSEQKGVLDELVAKVDAELRKPEPA